MEYQAQLMDFDDSAVVQSSEPDAFLGIPVDFRVAAPASNAPSFCADPPLRAPAQASHCVLVQHSSALVTAGLVSVLSRLAGWTVRTSEAIEADGQSLASCLSDVDVVVTDAEWLPARSEEDRQRLGQRPGDGPRFVLLSQRASRPGATEASPAKSVGARLSIHCAEADLVHAVRGAVPGAPETGRGHAGAAQGAQAGAFARGGLAPGVLRRVKAYVAERLAQKIELCELAALAGLSECHFARAFRESTGLPPHRYLLICRVAAASDMIRTTQQSLTEIGLEVGFSDQSHFTRVFKDIAGETPRAFRRRYR
jgi:AraC-like DNA-binding protein